MQSKEIKELIKTIKEALKFLITLLTIIITLVEIYEEIKYTQPEEPDSTKIDLSNQKNK